MPRFVARALPQATLTTFPGDLHDVLNEHDRDAVHAAVLQTTAATVPAPATPASARSTRSTVSPRRRSRWRPAIGTDMTRFATAAHLCSWARFAPGVTQSAGKNKGRGSTGHGNPYLARVLGEAAVTAGQTDTFLGERYRRIARRRGKKKAIVAVGRSILVIVWHLLSDPDTRYHDLGSDFYDNRLGPERKKRAHVRQLEALGFKVTLEPAA